MCMRERWLLKWLTVLVAADAEVRISMDPKSKEVTIISCDMSIDGNSVSTKSTSASEQTAASSKGKGEGKDAERVGLGCVTKWQGRFE